MMNDVQLLEFEAALKNEGLIGALRLLNQKTDHQFTGIYRYNGHKLENIALYDRMDASVSQAGHVPLSVTYCSLLKELEVLEILDRQSDLRPEININTPVNAYCGILLKDKRGQPFGSLCHWDMVKTDGSQDNINHLNQVSEIILEYLNEKERESL